MPTIASILQLRGHITTVLGAMISLIALSNVIIVWRLRTYCTGCA